MTAIYLDNNATTLVADEVLAAMTPYYREFYGNPHSAHSLGRKANEGLEQARRSVATLIGCDASEVVFTSCGTEGNALAIRGLLRGTPDRRRIVTTAVEHPSVITLLRALQSEGLIELVVVPVGGDGEIDLDAMRAAIDDTTLLVSVMLAQNETGVIHPVRAIADLAHARGALIHVDAVQAAGKIEISTRDLDADFLTISGHKFHAPKGGGALAIRRGLTLAPLWYGGGQELGLRSGTEAVPSLIGLGAAAELARSHLHTFSEVVALRDRLESSVVSMIDNVSINGAPQPRLGNTANIAFHDTAGDAIVRALDAGGICASAGAACDSGKAEPTATMKAMRKPLNVALGAVRFSLSRYTIADEIDTVVAVLPRIIREMRPLQSATR
ncbi:MAG: aminotransferase class V-fold PLP-dependent enzyme [Thermoanaerobaculia bacterium]|nr:aminotransferase class V-fold PLP-dependent enzyme [Thermoanaerobaculia bacterium]